MDPPHIHRQNASSFDYPPDSQQDWCYINLNSKEFVHKLAIIKKEYITEKQFCEFIYNNKDNNYPAYYSYYNKWKFDINLILNI